MGVGVGVRVGVGYSALMSSNPDPIQDTKR